jgi:hypothetical protein
MLLKPRRPLQVSLKRPSRQGILENALSRARQPGSAYHSLLSQRQRVTWDGIHLNRAVAYVRPLDTELRPSCHTPFPLPAQLHRRACSKRMAPRERYGFYDGLPRAVLDKHDMADRLSAYPKTSAALKVIQAHAKCSVASGSAGCPMDESERWRALRLLAGEIGQQCSAWLAPSGARRETTDKNRRGPLTRQIRLRAERRL